LASGAAHDLNNYLAPIVNYAELAMKDLEEDEVLYYDMEQILEAAKCAHGVTKQLLAFCRQDTTKSMEIININNNIIGSKKMLRRLLREDITFETKLDNKLDSVKCQLSQIDQILINMTVNAQDALPEGGYFTIETSNVDLDKSYQKFHPKAKPGSYILISFCDNGIGMSDDTIDKIFEHGFSTKGNAGTGVGLSTVMEIVDSLGGYIDILSEEHKGTCFKIYLPRIKKHTKEKSHTQNQAMPYGDNQWIIIVDDDIQTRRLTTRILDRFGYQVLEASSADEALQILVNKHGKINLVLTDVVLKGMNGIMLARQIETIYPDVSTLFMSGYSKKIVEKYGEIDLSASFLSKPFTMESLTKAVHNKLNS